MGNISKTTIICQAFFDCIMKEEPGSQYETLTHGHSDVSRDSCHLWQTGIPDLPNAHTNELGCWKCVIIHPSQKLASFFRVIGDLLIDPPNRLLHGHLWMIVICDIPPHVVMSPHISEAYYQLRLCTALSQYGHKTSTLPGLNESSRSPDLRSLLLWAQIALSTWSDVKT